MPPTHDHSAQDSTPYSAPRVHPLRESAPLARTAQALSFEPLSDWKQLRLVMLLCLIAAIAYVGRSCIGVASQAVQEDLQLTSLQMGHVMSAFFWSYALAQIPGGLVGQAWGPRRALVAFSWLGVLGCGLFAAARDIWSLVVCQVIFGISQAGLFPCAAQAIAHWVAGVRRAMSSGSLGAAMSVGAAVGTSITGLLLARQWQWREVYLLYAPLGLIWSLIFLISFSPPAPAQKDDVDTSPGVAPTSRRGNTLADSWFLFGAWDMWMICSQQFFRAAGYSFYLTWFPRYLQATRGLSVEKSGYFTMMPLLGVVAGGLLGGLAVDAVYRMTGSRRWSRQGAALVSLAGSTVFIMCAYFITDPLAAVLCISAGSFCGGLSGACAYTVTIDKAGQYVAPVFGLMNMTGNFGAAVCPTMVGLLLTYTAENWDAVLLLFAGVHLLAAICWTFLNPEGEFFPGSSSTLPAKEPVS